MKIMCFILLCAVGVELFFLVLTREQDAAQRIPLPDIAFNQVDQTNRQKLSMIYQDAVNQYQQSGKLHELVKISDVLLCYGYHLEAAQLYRLVLLRDGNQVRAWHGLSLCYDSLGQIAEAIRSYQVLCGFIESAQDKADYQHRVGELCLIMGDVKQAREIFAAQKDHAPSRYRYIRLLLHEGHYTLAKQEFNELIENPETALAVECQQLNDLSLRLCDQELEDLPVNQRRSLLSYQPIDIFKRELENYYGMSMMELFTPALREMPQMVEEVGVQAVDYWTLIEQGEIVAQGKKIFESHNCAICHGPEAYGNTGPNLRDDYWLGQSSPAGIYDTITYGRSNGSMPGHQFALRPDQIRDVTVYIVSLNQGTPKQDGRTLRGKEPQGTHGPIKRAR